MKYELFFEEEPNGKQSQFVEKLENQDNHEKIEYIRQIKEQLSPVLIHSLAICSYKKLYHHMAT